MRAKPIKVNGVQYPSARAAARCIVAEEAKLGNIRKENTVAKELKRCWQGACWDMYEKWYVKSGTVEVEAEGRLGTNVNG